MKITFEIKRARTKAAQASVWSNVLSHTFGKIFGTDRPTATGIIDNFETIPDLFIINNYLANKVARVPVKVVKPSGRDAPNSELYKLIENPNQFQSWKEFIRTDFMFYNILGNSYIYGIPAVGFDGKMTALYNLPADAISINLSRNKELPHYMNAVDSYIMELGGTKYTIPAEEILHSRYVNLRYTSGAWAYGISKYIPGDKINTELKAIYDAKTSLINQRGALGILSNESNTPSQEQSQIIQDRLGDMYGMKDGQKKFIVTTEKLTYQQMSMNVQELQLIENARYSFERLCQLSEVDPVIFSTEGSTYANKKEARKELYQNVLKPMVEDLYEGISNFIKDNYNNEVIVPDWDQVPEMQIDQKYYTDILNTQIEHGYLTPKKAGEIIYGDNYYEGDNEPSDDYYMKSGINKVTDEEEVQEPEEVVNPDLMNQLAEETETNTNGNGLNENTDNEAINPEDSVENISSLGLNGAQVAALLQIVQSYVDGLLTFDAAEATILTAFPFLDPVRVIEILSGANQQTVNTNGNGSEN